MATAFEWTEDQRSLLRGGTSVVDSLTKERVQVLSVAKPSKRTRWAGGYYVKIRTRHCECEAGIGTLDPSTLRHGRPEGGA